MSFGNWKDCYSDSDLWSLENTAALDIVSLLDQSTSEACIKEIEANPKPVALVLDPITDDLSLLHHVTRIVRTMKKKALASKRERPKG